MSLRIRPALPGDDAAWNAFVDAHPEGSPFHLTAWRDCIQQTFPYKPCPLLAEDGKEIRGVLPLFLVSSPMLGRVLLSSPFAVYGGALVRDEETRAALRQAVEDRARAEKVDYVELRNAWPSQCLGFERVQRYVTFTLKLEGSEEDLLSAIPRKTRNHIRKSLKCGLTSRHASDLEPFYRIYFTNLRRLGTPAFPRVHFQRILQAFAGSAYVLEVLHEGRPVAVMLTFEYKGAVMPYYGASDREFNHLAPNNFLFWELGRSGLSRGMRVLDFGRSKKIESDGVFIFKSQWGSEMRELPYEILLVRRRDIPYVSPANPRLRPFLSVWRHLPLWFTNRIGPMLVKWVP